MQPTLYALLGAPALETQERVLALAEYIPGVGVTFGPFPFPVIVTGVQLAKRKPWFIARWPAKAVVPGEFVHWKLSGDDQLIPH